MIPNPSPEPTPALADARSGMEHIGKDEIAEFLDGYIAQAQRTRVGFLWRPFLANGGDDLLLEAAVAGGAETYLVGRAERYQQILSKVPAVQPDPGDEI